MRRNLIVGDYAKARRRSRLARAEPARRRRARPSGRGRRPARRPAPSSRSPSRTASRRRSRAWRPARPPAGRAPSASCAASADECVQPEPCAAPSGWRSPGISTSRSPSKKTSVASSRWPPVTTTARGPERVHRARELLGVVVAPVAREHARLGQVRRHDGGPRQEPRRRSAARASGVEQPAPDSATITGSTHDRRARRQQRRAPRAPPSIVADVAEHPDLHRVDADVLGDRPDLRDDHRPAATGWTASTADRVLRGDRGDRRHPVHAAARRTPSGRPGCRRRRRSPSRRSRARRGCARSARRLRIGGRRGSSPVTSRYRGT